MKRFKDIFIGILIGYMIFATPVLAESILTKIDVVLNGVNVQVEGEDVEVNSILYNGTTYLPMRKVAELVGKDIEWYGDTMTANIVEVKKEGDILSGINYETRVYQGEDGYFYAEKDGKPYYALDYVSIELLNRKYEIDGSKYNENIIRFYNDNNSYEFECEVINDRVFISKDYYENTILPLIK